MNYFISGGCKNGKSFHAQRIAKEMAEKTGKTLYYLATMEPHDAEDDARIARHIEERAGWGFTTIERPTKICEIFNKSCLGNGLGEKSSETEQVAQIDACNNGERSAAGGPDPEGVFLLDSVTALLSNEMFRADGTVDLEAPTRVAAELTRFAEMTGSTVFVSDYIYSDAHLYDELTESYRKGLALCDRALAKACDKVLEVAFTNVTELK